MPDSAVPAATLTSASEPARRWRLGRLGLEVRRDIAASRRALFVALSVLLGIAISAAILIIAGVPPADLVNEFVVETLLDADSLKSVLVKAAPLTFIGLSAALAFRVRFWNLGLEGQMIFGGIAATAISLLAIGTPVLRLALMMLVAGAAGLLWVLIAALLKLKLRVNEIISTLLMNYIAQNFLLHLLYGPWRDPGDGFPHSRMFAVFEQLPEIAPGVSGALVLALAATGLTWWLVHMTRFGFHMGFVHASDRVAQAVGVPVRRVTLAAVMLSGAFAGIGGFIVVSGQEHRLTQSFFEGYGFSGVLIAFLARNNPIAAALVAVLVTVLFIAGQSLQILYQVPATMVQLIQAIIVMCVATSEFLIRHHVRWIR